MEPFRRTGASIAVRGEPMRAVAVATVALALVTASCASSGGHGGADGGGGTAVGAPPRKIELGLTAKGHTVPAHPGDVIEVRLGSTYWRFRPVTGGVLSRGRFVSRPTHGNRPPGTGAGAEVATFRALKPGTAHIAAGRQSCGEAMRCVGGQGSFALTVVVR
jgi:hypothetical protein